MSTIINGTSSAITFPDSTVQNTAFTTGAVTQSTIATGVAGTGPAFSAYASANQSISTTTFTKVILNVKNFDTANAFDSTTNYRFTPQVAGYYQINGSINCASSTSPTRVICCIYKNGTQNTQGCDSIPSTGGGQSTVSYLVFMNGTTDYLELFAYIAATVPSIYGTSNTTWFSGSLVRAA
jgi:hypothetical protein